MRGPVKYCFRVTLKGHVVLVLPPGFKKCFLALEIVFVLIQLALWIFILPNLNSWWFLETITPNCLCSPNPGLEWMGRYLKQIGVFCLSSISVQFVLGFPGNAEFELIKFSFRGTRKVWTNWLKASCWLQADYFGERKRISYYLFIIPQQTV